MVGTAHGPARAGGQRSPPVVLTPFGAVSGEEQGERGSGGLRSPGCLVSGERRGVWWLSDSISCTGGGFLLPGVGGCTHGFVSALWSPWDIMLGRKQEKPSTPPDQGLGAAGWGAVHGEGQADHWWGGHWEGAISSPHGFHFPVPAKRGANLQL